jgi:putative transposase
VPTKTYETISIGKIALESLVRQLKAERAENTPSASPPTQNKEKSVILKRKLSALRKKKKYKKGYNRSLDVRLPEHFSMIEKLKKSYAVKGLCEVFGVHRSNYHYWVNKERTLSSEYVLVWSEVRRTHDFSNGSSGE